MLEGQQKALKKDDKKNDYDTKDNRDKILKLYKLDNGKTKLKMNQLFKMSQLLMHLDKTVESNTIASLSPKKKSKCCGHKKKIEAPKEPEKYDYSLLLKANLDLKDMVDKGKDLYFDCPPLFFGKYGGLKSPEPEDYEYFKLLPASPTVYS